MAEIQGEESRSREERSLLSSTLPVPIAQLDPKLEAPRKRCVKAVVALIWPYASSRHDLTVLLAEPDMRLRSKGGQVRVHFAGPSARAVAEARIAGGDELLLGLEGVEWLEETELLSTPGTRVQWELRFSQRLCLEVIKARRAHYSTPHGLLTAQGQTRSAGL